jgi:hypothetical protein
VKNVKGEKRDRINKLKGAKLSGIKIPLMKTRGNLIRLLTTMISDVISLGIPERSSPSNDPKRVINTIPMIRIIICRIEGKEIERRSAKDVVMIRVMTKEYKNEAINIPKRI